MPIDVGHVIAGKYRLVRLIGRGSMGEVWAANHQSLDERVAVKLLMPPVEGEVAETAASAEARFLNEAQLAARLSRKTRHIVRVTDHGEENGLAYLVMEMLEGETLDAMFERERRLSLSLVSGIVGQIARALTHAHGEGVAHRDLKPANVFLTHDEDGRLLVKLLDFGIARAIHAHKAPSTYSTAKGLVFGTPSYMSPEQARASPNLDHRCDLWALSTIAYEAVTGDLPVNGKNADELLRNLCAGHIVPAGQRWPELGNRLDPFFEKALHEAIEDRFQSAVELAQAFARCAGVPFDLVVSSPSLPDVGDDDSDFRDAPTEPPPPPRSRTPNGVIAIGAVLVGCVALGAGWRALSTPPAHAQVGPAATTSSASSSQVTTPTPAKAETAFTAPTVATASAAPVASYPRPIVFSALPRPPSPSPQAAPPNAGAPAPVPPTLPTTSAIGTVTLAPPVASLPPPVAPPPHAKDKDKDRSDVF